MTDARATLSIKKLIDEGLVMLASHTFVQETIPTGVKALDDLLYGGIPRGQLTEIYGREGSGKSTALYHLIGSHHPKQRHVGLKKPVGTVFLDTEGSFDKQRAATFGADADSILLMRPEFGDQGFEAVLDFAAAGIRFFIIDSVTGMIPARILVEKKVGDDTIGLQAKLFGDFFSRYITMRKRPTLVVSSQVRDSVGKFGYGDMIHTPGGHAFHHYAYLRLEFRRRMMLRKGKNVLGQETVVKIVKSKYCPPNRDVTLFLLYDRGYVSSDEWERVRTKKKAKLTDE